MRDFVTTILDVLGLILVAGGVAAGVWPFIGAWAFTVAGAIVLVGSWWAAGGTVNWKRLGAPFRRSAARAKALVSRDGSS